MKRSVLILSVVALALSTAAAVAGGYKCNASTQDCLDQMAAHLQKTGWVGIKLDETENGRLQVTEVVADSPAIAAGFKKGDVLVAMDGIRYADENQEAMMKAKEQQHPGSQVTYTVERNGKARDIQVTLAKVPQDVLAQWIGAHMLQHAHVEIAQN
jgi:S1-C subfamily serine protease